MWHGTIVLIQTGFDTSSMSSPMCVYTETLMFAVSSALVGRIATAKVPFPPPQVQDTTGVKIALARAGIFGAICWFCRIAGSAG